MEEDDSRPIHSPFFTLDGTEVSKARYLSQAFQAFKKVGSTDRLKRVAQMQRYSAATEANDIIAEDPLSSANILTIDMPIASLLKCEGCTFLCVGEVNDILLDSVSVDEINVDSLYERSVVVSYQMLYLTSATANDDPGLKYDWQSSYRRGTSYNVSGHLIQPIDPGVSAKSGVESAPYYLCKSEMLVGAGALLLQHVAGLSMPIVIPTVKQSVDFPYTESKNGKLRTQMYLIHSLSHRKGLFSL